MSEWYYEQNGERKGPVTDADLARLISDGIIGRGNYVWTASFGNQWKFAGDVSALFPPPPENPVSLKPIDPPSAGPAGIFEICSRGGKSVRGNFGVMILSLLLFIAINYALGMIWQISAFLSLIPVFVLCGTGLDSIPQSDDPAACMQWLAEHPESIGAVCAALIFIAVTYVASLCAVEIFRYGLSYKMPLDAVRSHHLSVSDAFAGLNRWKIIVKLMLIVWTRVFLWSLLLIIPGIAAALSYSMAMFIIADNENITANEAADLSRKMMSGHRLELLGLLLFLMIGGTVFCLFTFGIGLLWFAPYMNVTLAEFYSNVKSLMKNR